jgi:hypothetical protein
MIKLFQSILAANRKRRCRVAGLTLWLLRLIRDVEETEMYRYSDELDKINLVPEKVPRRDYAAIEEECFNCECALGFLECAIDDLKFAY